MLNLRIRFKVQAARSFILWASVSWITLNHTITYENNDATIFHEGPSERQELFFARAKIGTFQTVSVLLSSSAINTYLHRQPWNLS
jgi:hypothetical protein